MDDEREVERIPGGRFRHYHGRPCEVCGKPLAAHDWVGLDAEGYAVECSTNTAPAATA